MKILIKNGRIIDPVNKRDETASIFISDGVICNAFDENEAQKVIDASGNWVVPGFVDLHAHFRDPGLTHKEDLESGAKSAVAGGFTTVCVMPNTKPALDTPEQINYIVNRSKEIALCDILPIGAITKDLKGEELTDFAALKKAGAVAFSDDGVTVKNAGVMLRAFEEAAELDMPIFAHCEDVDIMQGGVMNDGDKADELDLPGIHPAAEEVIVARDIILADYANARLHICHVSVEGAVDAIKNAKARGAKVTAEVCPHHFILTDEDITGKDSNFKMNPPLRADYDIDAIKQGLKNGTIDCIATDHAPHSADEKAQPFAKAPFGIVGLETALSLSLDLVREGLLTEMELINLLSAAPSKIIGIEKGCLTIGRIADIAIINPNKECKIDPEKFASKSKNTPFAGRKVRGEVEYTIAKGRIVYGD